LFWADFEDEGVQNGLSLKTGIFEDEEGKTGVSSLKTGIFEDEGEEEPGKRCIFAEE
jgi:hypothetical protein